MGYTPRMPGDEERERVRVRKVITLLLGVMFASAAAVTYPLIIISNAGTPLRGTGRGSR